MGEPIPDVAGEQVHGLLIGQGGVDLAARVGGHLLAQLPGFGTLSLAFQRGGQLVRGERHFPAVAGSGQHGAAFAQEGGFAFPLALIAQPQGGHAQGRAPQLAVGALKEPFQRLFEMIARDGGKALLFKGIEHVEVERVFKGGMGQVAPQRPARVVGQQRVRLTQAAMQIVVEGDAPHGAHGGLVVFAGGDRHEEAVQIEEGGVHIPEAQHDEGQMQHPEHGQHAVPVERGGAAARLVDAEGDVILLEVKGRLARAGGQQHGEAAVFPAVGVFFLFVAAQNLPELAAHVMQKALEEGKAALHVLVVEVFEIAEFLYGAGRLAGRFLVGKEAQVEAEDGHQQPETFVAAGGRDRMGGGGKPGGHL